jgi:hypothetical protein
VRLTRSFCRAILVLESCSTVLELAYFEKLE